MPALRSLARLLGAMVLLQGAAAEAASVTYKVSRTDFPNPERGFYIAEGYDPEQGWTDPLASGRLREARAKVSVSA